MIRRLILGYLLVTVVVVTVLAVPFGVLFSTQQRERLAVGLERDATVIAGFYEDALEHGEPFDPRPVDRYADETGARVVVVDKSGISLADSGATDRRDFSSRPEIIAALQGRRFSGSRPSETLGTELFVVAVPVSSGGRVHGAVRITLPADVVAAKVRSFWVGLGAVALVAVGATLVVAFAVARTVVAPLRRLRAAALAVGAGNLGTEAHLDDAPPELREVADAFNEMSGRIADLVEKQRAFVADASHQLRTPFTALRLHLENAAEAARGTPAADDLSRVLSEVERLGLLFDQLLELSRAEGRPPGEVQTDLVEVVRDRVATWRPLAEDSERELLLDGPEGVVPVTAPPEVIEQVLDNLLDNALRYSTPKTPVRVLIRSSPNPELHVVDAGPGLAPEERERAFDRFWRGHHAPGDGSGLGLSIVRHLVEGVGGSVELRPAPGGGTDACVTWRRPQSPS